MLSSVKALSRDGDRDEPWEAKQLSNHLVLHTSFATSLADLSLSYSINDDSNTSKLDLTLIWPAFCKVGSLTRTRYNL